jgi:IPT/TIG domain-containing protein
MHEPHRWKAARLFAIVFLSSVLMESVGAGVAWAAAPTITSFNPTSGPVGTSVTIKGSNFTDPLVNAVWFDNHDAAAFSVVNDTTITATVPSNGSDGPILVHNSDGTATSSSNFNVTSSGGGSGGPTITSFNPTSGPVGTSVTINGSNFTGATSVTFNNVAASFNVNNASRITAQVPNGATDGRIRVTTPQGTATSSSSFNVTSSGGPTITSFNPTSGPVGTSVTINGSNFTGATSVTFNNVAASFTVNSATRITATVPSGATTGRIRVSRPGGTATSATNFIVTQQVHPRTLSLRLRRHLVARGHITVADGFAACMQGVAVNIQRLRRSGSWRTLKTTTTASDGSYHARLRDRPGMYRTTIAQLTLAGGAVCGAATALPRRHRH